ncbi:MAG: CHAT domain-containing tetratricopeptide repeat protein [Candidatus Sumerlaeota bacterium]|nr:CHAT domain-containing tetratricopeptide repeat protein [Candidatus Sumerlaeota bacterium]
MLSSLVVLAFTIPDAARAQDMNSCQQTGLKAIQAGDYKTAAEAWAAGLKLAEQQNSDKGRALFLANLGALHTDLGQYDKAVDYLKRALPIQRKLGDAKAEGQSLNNLGVAYEDLGQYEKALETLEQAAAIWRKLGDAKGEGATLSNMGLIYDDFGQRDKALEHYLKALALRRQIGDAEGEANDLINIGMIYWDRGQNDKALESLQQALAINRKIGDVRSEGTALSDLGLVYRDLGQHDKALESYEQALAIARRIGNVAGEGADLGAIGLSYKMLGQYDKALEYYAQALAIHRKIGDRKREGDDLNNMGAALLRAGRLQEANERLAAAVQVYEALRGQVRGGEERTGFQSTLPTVYDNLATARIAMNDPAGAFEAVERGRAKSFLDLLATREVKGGKAGKKAEEYAAVEAKLSKLQNQRTEVAQQPAGEKSRSAGAALDGQISALDKQRLDLIDEMRRSDPELGSLLAVQPPDAKEIQSLLPEGATLIEYFHPGEKVVAGTAKDELWIFVVKRDALERVTAPVSREALTQKLEAYAALLADSGSDAAKVQAAGAELAGWIVKPIEARLAGGPAIVVPWGPMFKVPFAALAPAGNTTFVTTPAAGLYRYLLPKRASGRGAVCALGNPKTALSALPGAEREAREIAALFPKSAVKLNEEATESLAKSGFATLGNPDVVHFACHGIFNDKAPQLSYLALTPDRANDGKMEMHEVFGLDWRGVSLVTMSACSSGKGKLGVGDDLAGLTRGFMFAGAPSVLCSLWDVDDEATRALMVAFYHGYIGGLSKPEALREAQRAVRESADHPDWSHPYYWAAFTLWGDWQ